jgi:hypothetical protein
LRNRICKYGFAIFLFALSVSISSEDLNSKCFSCHGMNNFSYLAEDLNAIRSLTVSPKKFEKSVHGKLSCTDCHKETKNFPHKPILTKVGCNQDCHAFDSEGKVYNHSNVVLEFDKSIHAKGKNGKSQDSPNCSNCHGITSPHDIVKVTKTITAHEKMTQCVVCHDNKEMMERNHVEVSAFESYKQSFHYKSIKFKGKASAVCQDCHGVHGILPKDNLESSISNNNLAKTCGKSGCHEGAEINFAMSGANHLKARIDKEPILWWEEKMFQILTGGTLGMLVIGIILDIQKKFGWMSILKKFTISIGKILKNIYFIFYHVMKKVLHFIKVILWD